MSGGEASTPAEIAAALDRLVAAPAPLLVVADFDGTLAAGSRDPAAAAIDPGARRALRRLAGIAAGRPGRLHLAILTGRTVADVAARARVGGIEYLGDHGLQSAWLDRGRSADAIAAIVEPGFEAHGVTTETLASGVADELGRPPWLFVERKGASVAFHVRQADDIPAARSAVFEAIAAVEARLGLVGHGLRPYRGRSVVDLRPGDAGGKREAVERLIERHRPGAVVSIGDDLSDADAFDAVLAGRETGRTQGLTIAVHGRLAAPAEVLVRADLVVGSARDVGRLLGGLARRLEREGQARGRRVGPRQVRSSRWPGRPTPRTR
jgi:trehalose 6-phosphate phosphatase